MLKNQGSQKDNNEKLAADGSDNVLLPVMLKVMIIRGKKQTCKAGNKGSVGIDVYRVFGSTQAVYRRILSSGYTLPLALSWHRAY